jgi:hypothetical protein
VSNSFVSLRYKFHVSLFALICTFAACKNPANDPMELGGMLYAKACADTATMIRTPFSDCKELFRSKFPELLLKHSEELSGDFRLYNLADSYAIIQGRFRSGRWFTFFSRTNQFEVYDRKHLRDANGWSLIR